MPVCAPAPEKLERAPADDAALRRCHGDGMSRCAVRAPGEPLLQRQRLGVERGGRVEDVMVLDVVEDPRVGGCREADRALSHGSETGYSAMDWNVIRRWAARGGE